MREDMYVCPICGSPLAHGTDRCNVCGAINQVGGNDIYNETTQAFDGMNEMVGGNQVPPQMQNRMSNQVPPQMQNRMPNQAPPQMQNRMPNQMSPQMQNRMMNQMPPQMPNQMPPQNQPQQDHPKKSRAGLYIGLTMVAIILIAAIVVVLFIFMNKDDEDNDKDKEEVTTTEEAKEDDADEEDADDTKKGIDIDVETTTAEEETEERNSDSGSSDAVIDYSETYMVSYDGFDIEIPEYWSGRVYIEEYEINSHFGHISFYQAASYDTTGGEIATICWYIEGDEDYMALPSYKKLGTGNGKQYIMTYPTDIQYDYDDEAISQEYANISSGLYVIEDSFTVTESTETMQFIFPDSDSAYISSSRITACTDLELRIAKNELYARRGRIFETEPFVTYFSKLSWYDGYISADDFEETNFNDYEIANRDAIVEELSNRGLQ